MAVSETVPQKTDVLNVFGNRFGKRFDIAIDDSFIRTETEYFFFRLRIFPKPFSGDVRHVKRVGSVVTEGKADFDECHQH